LIASFITFGKSPFISPGVNYIFPLESGDIPLTLIFPVVLPVLPSSYIVTNVSSVQLYLQLNDLIFKGVVLSLGSKICISE